MARREFLSGVHRFLDPALLTTWTGATIRALLTDSTTTCDTDSTALTEFLTDFTTLGEHADSTRVDVTSKTININTVIEEVEYDAADNLVFPSISASPDVAGVLLYIFGTTDADSYPLVYIDDSPEFPATGDGGNMTITPPGAGWLVFKPLL